MPTNSNYAPTTASMAATRAIFDKAPAYTRTLAPNFDKPRRVATSRAHMFSRALMPFTNNSGSLYGEWVTGDCYVVFSYGEHFPLYVFDALDRCWYANSDRYSRTTSKHATYANPGPVSYTRPAFADATPCDTNVLRRIIANARAR